MRTIGRIVHDLCTANAYLISFFFIIIFLSAPVNAEQNETIKIVVEQYEPMTYFDEDGVFRGFSIDLINSIAVTEDWKVEYTLLPWTDCLESVKNGDADLLIAVAYTNERDTFLDYTNDSIALEWSQVYAQKNSDIISIRDLDGKKVVVVKDDYGVPWIIEQTRQYDVEYELIEVDNYDTILLMLENNSADAGLFARSYAINNDLYIKLEMTAIETFPVFLYCATTEGQNQELIETINSYLVDLKSNNNSVYYQLETKWFSHEVPAELPQWVVILLGLSFLFILIFVAVSIVLKQQVRKGIFELTLKNEELIVSEKKYSTLVEESKDGIIIVQDGLLVFANQRIAEMIEYDLDEILNSSAFNYVPKECATMVAKLYDKRIGSDPDIPSTYELDLMRKNNGPLTVEMCASLIENDGRPAVMVIIRDIEERKQAELMKEEKIRVEEADRAKSDFLANMSHELRTPLNAVIGFSEMLELQTFGKLNEKQQRYVDNISSSGRHLLDLINGILDLSKVEAGKMELHIEKFTPSSIIHDVVTALMPLAMKRGVELSYNVDDCPDSIDADRLKFKQILFNLASNSLKFTNEGGSVNISASCIDDDLLVSVKDTGKGISEDDQKIVFHPFVQVGKFDSKEKEGTGLGLSLVRSFVELHGGSVWLESELGVGTTFYFRMPINIAVPNMPNDA